MKSVFYLSLLIATINISSGQGNWQSIEFVEIANYRKQGKFYHKLEFDKTTSVFHQWKNFEPLSGYASDANGTTYKQDLGCDNEDLDFYIHYLNNDDLLIRDNYLCSSIYYKENLAINWQLQKETKVIMGYNCQKAVTHYKNKNYVAWFALELPFSFGPWKLNGLPGLILELKEEKGLVHFIATRITLNSTKSEIVDEYIEILDYTDFKTYDEFCELKNKLHIEERKFIQSRLPKGVRLAKECEDCNNELENCN